MSTVLGKRKVGNGNENEKEKIKRRRNLATCQLKKLIELVASISVTNTGYDYAKNLTVQQLENFLIDKICFDSQHNLIDSTSEKFGYNRVSFANSSNSSNSSNPFEKTSDNSFSFGSNHSEKTPEYTGFGSFNPTPPTLFGKLQNQQTPEQKKLKLTSNPSQIPVISGFTLT